MPKRLFPEAPRCPLPPLSFILSLLLLGSRTATAANPPRPQGDAPPAAVTCLGYLDPERIHLMPPASSFPVPPPVSEVLVTEGSRITNGQVVAVLENKNRLELAWRVAEAQARVAEHRLARVKGNVLQTEIDSLRAESERAQAELELARKEHARTEELAQGGAATAAESDRTRLTLQARAKAFEAAQKRLENVIESREVERLIAEGELEHARAQTRQAETEVSQAVVRSPLDGLILKIFAHPGERPDTDGIAELVRTNPFYVTAEVYETDIRYVQAGQRVEVTTPAAPQTLKGVVERLGHVVGRNLVMDNDPATLADSRVVEVKVRMEDDPWLTRLIGARVQVRILR